MAPQKVPLAAQPQDAPPQRLILEARISKPASAPEPGKQSGNKSIADTGAAIREGEPARAVTPSVKEVTKPEFASPEHKDKPAAMTQDPQLAAKPELVAAPVMNVETGRAPAIRPLSHDPAAPQAPLAPEMHEAPQGEQTPLKRLELRIPDANGGGVTVRVQERAGAVQVSVRSNDAQLASGVAEHLPDLARTLDRQGYRSEMRIPAEANLIPEGAPETLLRPSSTRDRAVESVHAHSEPASLVQPEQTRSGNQPNDRDRKPDWQEEMYKRPKRPSDENFKEYLS
jgi:hypothetical protein